MEKNVFIKKNIFHIDSLFFSQCFVLLFILSHSPLCIYQALGKEYFYIGLVVARLLYGTVLCKAKESIDNIKSRRDGGKFIDIPTINIW